MIITEIQIASSWATVHSTLCESSLLAGVSLVRASFFAQHGEFDITPPTDIPLLGGPILKMFHSRMLYCCAGSLMITPTS